MSVDGIMKGLLDHFPELSVCRDGIMDAYELLVACYDQQGTVYTCGNGGSAADAAHIVGELMKGFIKRRPLPKADQETLAAMASDDGRYLASHLQVGLRALSLMSQEGLTTAVGNDLGGDLGPAQQLMGLAREGDILLGISTSGNARNIALACRVAKLKRLKIIGMTGDGGGALASLADVCIKVPARETYRVQEYHLPIYHALCMMVEERYFTL